MHKTLKYGEPWELATLELATLLLENAGKRSQLISILLKQGFFALKHFSRSIRTNMSKTRDLATL